MQFRLNTHTKVNSFVLGINDWTEDIEKRLSDGNKQVVKEALDSIRTRVCAIVNSREERMKKSLLKHLAAGPTTPDFNLLQTNAT